MVDINEVKTRIINFLKAKGPSLPVQISRELRMETIIISAFLGELLNEKKLKTSSLRVGGTPLYLLSGDEPKLENFQKYLHPKEQEAFLLIKNSRILKDSDQEPAIRVALRNIKDFAFSFKNDEQIYWRYLTVTENEVRNLLEPIIGNKQELKIEPKPEIKQETIEPSIENKVLEKVETKIDKPIEKPEEKLIEKPKEKIIKARKPKENKAISSEIKPLTEFVNPLAIKIVEKPEKIKPKSEFVLKVIRFLEKSGFKILEEKEFKKNEYNCISETNTELGPIAFLTQAKDKKTVSDQDLDKLLRQAQSIPLPALMITPGGLSKKALEYQQKYYSILKIKKI